MAANGKLEKMLILAFESSDQAEGGGKAEAQASFDAFINPESYTLDYKVNTSNDQGHGTSGAQSKFLNTMPEELNFEFLFDNTGIIDQRGRHIRGCGPLPEDADSIPGENPRAVPP
jgi:hypothetical protein